MKHSIITCILFFLAFLLHGQRDRAFAINERLGRGINYGNMLEAPSEHEWGNPWKSEYPQIIAALGFDHVRIPIRWEPEERSSDTPPYTIAADFLERVKEVVDATLDQELMVVINMHHHERLYADPDGERMRFLAQWEQIASAFKDYPDNLLFEILNEPHGSLTPEKWNVFFRDALEVIRERNPDRVVLIGTPEYGGLGGLSALDLPNDPDIILTVHYYNPFQFTHQGAEWLGEDADDWLGTEWQDTDVERAVVQSEFSPLIALSENENVPVHIGEFGAYSTADIVAREKWTTFLARYFEKLGWSWAYWEFSAGFGIYNPDDETFVQELTDALLHNTMPEPATFDRTTVYRSDFTAGTDGWQLQTSSGATADLTQDDGALHVTIGNGGAEAWHVQLVKNNLPLDTDKKYSVAFRAKSHGGARTVNWYVGMSVDPWSAYSSWNQASLTESLIDYVTTFDMVQTDHTARIAFDLGTEMHDVTITEVLVEELELKLPTDEDPKDPDTVLSIQPYKPPLVYPISATDMLNIDNNGQYHELILVNLIGQKLFSTDLTSGLNVISLKELEPGTYVIMLEGEQGIQIFKIIRE